jgi:5-methylcytosine-specific restriction endonuclease McrA
VLKQWEVGNRRITIDHITPTSKGGINDITNKRLLHYHCNQQRGNSDIMSLKELSA